MRYENARRYLIRLESGMIIRCNRIHLRKRFTNCDFGQNAAFSQTDPNVLFPECNAETDNNPHQRVGSLDAAGGTQRPHVDTTSTC